MLKLGPEKNSGTIGLPTESSTVAVAVPPGAGFGAPANSIWFGVLECIWMPRARL